MKPKDFPERKRQRRIDALERREDMVASVYANKTPPRRHLVEIASLKAAIGDNARGVRTKKDRSAFARIAR